MRYILWLSVAALIGTYICSSVGDPDLWWHITVGKWILAHRTVPTQEYWNLFAAGQPWRAYSWSNEIVFALIDHVAGPQGLLVAQLVLAVALAATIQWVVGAIAHDHWFGIVLGAFAATACFGHFSLRPQVVVWILFAGALLVSDTIAERGVSVRRLIALVLCGCAWANTHLTAVIGLVGIALWGVQNQRGEVLVQRTACAASAFLFGTLLTPYLGGEWLTLFSKSGHPLKFQSIIEFQPANVMQYSTVFPLLLLVLLVVVSFGTRILPPIARILCMGGLLLGGLGVVKFLPFAVIALACGVAVWWRTAGTGSALTGAPQEPSPSTPTPVDNLTEGLRLLRQKTLGFSPETHGALAFVAFALSVLNVTKVWKAPLDAAMVPQAAVDFIVSNSLPRPVAGEFATGGYLMYRFSTPQGEPESAASLVTVDGRTNVNPPEIWELYQKSFMGRVGWKEYLDRSGAKSILWRQPGPMIALLLESKEWCHLFGNLSSSKDFLVFIRKDAYLSQWAHLPSANCRAE